MSGSNSSNPAAGASAPQRMVEDPLSLTVHGGPTAALPQRARGRLTAFLVLLACAAPVIVSYFAYYVWRPSGRTNYAELIQPTRPMPADLELRTLGGEPVSPQQLHGQWLLVMVGGGACDATCESHLYEQRQIREMTGRERQRVDRVWLVTDEAPLRAPIQRALGEPGQDGAATALRADPVALARWLQPAPGHALDAHLYVIDPMGAWMMRAPAPLTEPKRLHKDIDRLLRASAFWDRPGRGG
jgi:hypothetical protein